MAIDSRLIEPNGEPEIVENFNRTLKLIDEGGGGGGLPEVTTEDAGKVLTVNAEGEWDAEEAGSGLPEVGVADAGKFLVVDAQGEWAATTVPNADNMSF